MTTARALLVELYSRNRVLAVLGLAHLAALAVLLLVAPFLSFHALRLLPLAALYAAGVSLIFWQAMRGRPLLSPGAFVL